MTRVEFENDLRTALEKRLKEELNREPTEVEIGCYIDRSYERYLDGEKKYKT